MNTLLNRVKHAGGQQMLDFKQYEAVIFDMDGTLLDSMSMWLKIDEDYLSVRGYTVPEDLNKQIEGMSFTETAEYFKNRFNLPESTDVIKAEWIEMADGYYRNKVQMKPGAMCLLEHLNQLNIPMAVATSSSRHLAEAALKAHGIDRFFSVVKTSCEVEKGKPFPFIYLKAAEELAVNPVNCLAFEDTEAGVDSALGAGMTVVAIYDDMWVPFMDDIKAKSHYYLNSFNELF